MQTSIHQKVLKMVQLAILVALVVVLQLFGSGIKLGPVSISLVLIPIVVGAVLLGPAAGALLGFVFGLITVIAGFTGMDGFTFILMQTQPVITTLICLAKATLAGLAAGWIFRLLQNKNRWVAVILASAAAPVVNTGIFVLGALTLLGNTISTNFVAADSTLIYFVIIGCAGINFIVEFCVNLVASPAIYRIWTAITHRK